MLWLYSLAWYLALPWVLLSLWRRGAREPGYRQHWRERLALYQTAPQKHDFVIWLHAVSVGETRAAQPLLLALLQQYPQAKILLTHMTPTGRATGAELFGKYGDRVQQVYMPYDTGAMQARFLRQFAPRICILMETEVWPNAVAQCVRAGVPVCLVNARLSARSLRKGQRYARLLAPASAALSVVAAQTVEDAERLLAFGTRKPVVTGSIKFDVAVPGDVQSKAQALKQQIFPTQAKIRPILLCASTREGEEILLLDAYQQAQKASTTANFPLLLLVPRHPQRFNEVEQMLQARGLRYQRRSQISQQVEHEVDVILGDSMGEMFMYCALADIVFVGGSLLPLGGQNPIEACALGKPVLFGEHTFNFDWVCAEAVNSGAALRVSDAQAMMAQVCHLLQDAAQLGAMGQQAYQFAAQHRGATARTLALLQDHLR